MYIQTTQCVPSGTAFRDGSPPHTLHSPCSAACSMLALVRAACLPSSVPVSARVCSRGKAGMIDLWGNGTGGAVQANVTGGVRGGVRSVVVPNPHHLIQCLDPCSQEPMCVGKFANRCPIFIATAVMSGGASLRCFPSWFGFVPVPLSCLSPLLCLSGLLCLCRALFGVLRTSEPSFAAVQLGIVTIIGSLCGLIQSELRCLLGTPTKYPVQTRQFVYAVHISRTE